MKTSATHENFAGVADAPSSTSTSSNSSLGRATDTLIDAGTKVLSYAPQSVKARIETAYAKAGELRTAVQDYVSTKADVATQQLARVTAEANSRYAAIASRASVAIEAAVAMAFLGLQEVNALAIDTAVRTWDRVPKGIKTRASLISHSAGVRATAISARANTAWKHVSEDPKARMTAKAGVGGAAAGGATGFVAGGSVGALVGIIPAFFTFGLSIPLGAAIGSGIGLSCGAATGGAVGLASGAAYANKEEIQGEVTRGASRCKDYVKDQAAHIQDRASVSASKCKDYVKDQAAHIQDKASVSVSAVTRKLRRSGTGGTA